jgi:hypothetical protein
LELVKLIEDQAFFGFSGKTNILLKENGQYVGAIHQKDGVLVHAKLGNIEGKKALLSIISNEMENTALYKFSPEPEIFNDEFQTFSYTFNEFVSFMNKFLSQYYQAKKLMPPTQLVLEVKQEFLKTPGSGITPEEFELLYAIAGSKNVGEIYKKSSLCDFEITMGLVALKKKGAIQVSR